MSKVFRFGPYRLVEESQQLFVEDKLLALNGKRFELLQFLVENAGKVVRKEDLFSQVWPGRFIEEANLTQNIYMIRRLIGDDSKSPKFIITVPGVGYLFFHSVQVEDLEADEVEKQENARLTVEEKQTRLPLLLRAAKGRWGSSSVPGRVVISLGALILALTILLPLLRPLLSRLYSSKAQSPKFTITPLATMPGLEMDPNFSADGRFIAFSSEGEIPNNQDIYVRVISQGKDVRVTSNPLADKQPVWSPDGRRIAFLRVAERFGDRHRLIIASAFGGAEREIARVWGGLDWSPDGSYLAVSDADRDGQPPRIWMIGVDGVERRQMTAPPSNGSLYDTLPCFSPDGRSILFLRWRSGVSSDLFIVDTQTRRERQITFDNRTITGHSWTSDGQEILFVSNRDGHPRLWRASTQELWLSQSPHPTLPTLVEGLTEQPYQIDVSPIGGMLAYTQRLDNSAVEVRRISGANATPCLVDSSRPDHSPRISPDGRQIVFVSERSGASQIWIAGVDCSNVRQLTWFKGERVGSPRWSNDGVQIVFDGYVDGSSQIFVIHSDGTSFRQLTNHSAADTMPSWAPNDRSIYFSTMRSGHREIWRQPLDGANPILVTVSPGRDPLPTADGRFLYFTVRDVIWCRDLSTGQEGPVPELANRLVGRSWDLGDRAIHLVQSSLDAKPVVYRFDLEQRRLDPVATLPGPLPHRVPGISVSRDESLLISSYLRYRLGDITLFTGWSLSGS